jgi:hypothetical protein
MDKYTRFYGISMTKKKKFTALGPGPSLKKLFCP